MTNKHSNLLFLNMSMFQKKVFILLKINQYRIRQTNKSKNIIHILTLYIYIYITISKFDIN